MKNHVVEILSFLFERCASFAANFPHSTLVQKENLHDGDEILDQLTQHGFSIENVQEAFGWFYGLLAQQSAGSGVIEQSTAMRVFLPRELDKIGKEGCDFILFLQKINLLNAKTREIAITQVMCLPQQKCNIEEVKWVILMVLISQQASADVIKQLEKYSLYLMPKDLEC